MGYKYSISTFNGDIALIKGQKWLYSGLEYTLKKIFLTGNPLCKLIRFI